jgi:DNA-binding transcriptional LysR family regulator
MRDLNVDQIKKLWVLNLIVQSGSFKKAALLAKVSPSAISQTVSALERSTSKLLLIRDKGGVAPTQDAIAMLNIVRPAFDAFEKLRSLSQAQPPQMSWLNFGTYESIAVDILPGLIRRLRVTLPHLKLSLRVNRSANLLTMIRKGELCAALITETDDLDGFYVKEVYEDRLGFFVSAKLPIARLGWKATKDYGVGSLSPGKDGLPRYYTRFLKQLADVRPTLLSDSFEVLRTAAAAGVIVSVLPHRVGARQSDLVEIFPRNSKNVELGKHRLLMVGLANSSLDEVNFLSAETTQLLNKINIV